MATIAMSDPGPVVAPDVADHQESGQEAEHRRAQGEEGRHALCRDRPIEPPGRQPSHRDQHRERATRSVPRRRAAATRKRDTTTTPKASSG